jgi:hypothetical protein
MAVHLMPVHLWNQKSVQQESKACCSSVANGLFS